MFVIYADTLYLGVIFVVLATAALFGLWRYNAEPETEALRAIELSDDVRAEVMHVRNEVLKKAMEEKKLRIAKKAELRRSLKANGDSP